VSATRRLFFALWPDEATRARLAAACAGAAQACGGRPVSPANYHLTLVFLGSVPADSLAALQAAVRDLAPPAVELRLDTFGHFRGADVLWLGSREPAAEMTAFAAQLRARVQALGLPADGKPFQPHLTIARKLPSRPRRAPPAPLAVPLAWPVRDFVLVDSVTDPAGARYEVLGRYPPAGAG
jgi:2'-5' RNA ligase